MAFIFNRHDIDSAKAAIWDHLVSHPEVAEYDLVCLVDGLGLFAWPEDFSLRLFHKHFIVQHCLYHLRQEKFRDFSIEITPLKIQLLKTAGARQEVGNEVNTELAEYYLELNNLAAVSVGEVTELLADFWRRYDAHRNRDGYLEKLGLEPDADWEAVQARYRELAGRMHPDKGGDAEAFIEIRQAFEALRKRF